MRVVTIVAIAAATLVLAGAGFLLWARSAALGTFARSWDIQEQEVPVPWPLTDREVAELQSSRGEDEAPLDAGVLERIALDRAIERGRALVETRLGCGDCHGVDFGGRVVLDVGIVGRMAGPNLTLGKGSVTSDFTSADWVRILRHGVNQLGQSSLMPAVDYESLADQEISDIIAFIRSKPAVDRDLEPSRLGPILWINYALGNVQPAAERIDHEKVRRRLPPVAAATEEYGEHVAKVCRGCHGMDFRGGKIAEGDPSWPPAANLTPDETGLAGWTREQFFTALREGTRPDGRTLDPEAMPWPSIGKSGEVEIEAMYLYFQSLDPLPKGS